MEKHCRVLRKLFVDDLVKLILGYCFEDSKQFYSFQGIELYIDRTQQRRKWIYKELQISFQQGEPFHFQDFQFTVHFISFRSANMHTKDIQFLLATPCNVTCQHMDKLHTEVRKSSYANTYQKLFLEISFTPRVLSSLGISSTHMDEQAEQVVQGSIRHPDPFYEIYLEYEGKRAIVRYSYHCWPTCRYVDCKFNLFHTIQHKKFNYLP